jgi:SAM-dependent methyltransferase
MNCIACANSEFVSLPSFDRAMMSDGRILDRRLRKERCTACGLIRHVEQLDKAAIEVLYSTDYALPSFGPEADAARAEAYLRDIQRVLPGGFQPGTVLDVGSGSGALAKLISAEFTNSDVFGIDPAGSTCTDGNVTLLNGFLEDHREELPNFDLIVSINTLEHVADPIETLNDFREVLNQGGVLVLVCPTSIPSNVELLFFDHIWSFTPEAFERVGASCGFSVLNHRILSPSLGDFQIMALTIGEACEIAPSPDAHTQTDRYLRAWTELDGELLRRTGADDIMVFGAGQMAALLRCYTPRVWAKSCGIIMDVPDPSWGLGPVNSVPESLSPDLPIVIGTHPRHHGTIADRINSLGGRAVRFDDLIER